MFDPAPPPADLPDPQRRGTSQGLDCETAVFFRAVLDPIFDQADSWQALIDRLAAKGLGLAIRGGRLMLIDRASSGRICTARFLGKSLADLSQRLGKPRIVPRPGNGAAGEFLNGPRSD